MCYALTACQSMAHKPLVKIGTGATLSVLQEDGNLQR